MFFQTEVSGIPYTCHVLNFVPAKPMIITGKGYGAAYPPEPEEFDYELQDDKGNVVPESELELSSYDKERLIQTYKAFIEENSLNSLM